MLLKIRKNQSKLKSGSKKLDVKKLEQYFDNLAGHYEACYNKKMLKGKEIDFLILEDFNTVGLEGDKADSFFRKDNIRTDTNTQAGGSHGIGKRAILEASQITTIFAYSIFKDGEIFEGKAAFKTHKKDNKWYKEDGTLKLNRDYELIKLLFDRKAETGLSIAIPCVRDPEIKIEKLNKKVL